jgi:hypothetical protein
MAFETKDGKKYAKAVVGPPHAQASAFADDFGAFTIVCTLPRASLKTKLVRIKSAFGLEGTYKIGQAIGIEAESGFRRFDEVGKWGRIKLVVSEAADSEDPVDREISFKLIGRWWNQNRDGRAMPIFEGEDAVQFKRIFEEAIGETEACNLLTPKSFVPQP